MDWYSGRLDITTPGGWHILHTVPGVTLIEAQDRLKAWKQDHPGVEHSALYYPYPVEVCVQ